MAEALRAFGALSSDAQCIVGLIIVLVPATFVWGAVWIVAALKGKTPPQ